MHKCDGTTPVELVCGSGCNVNAPNTDDTCKGTSGGGAIWGHVLAAAGDGYAMVRWSPAATAQSGFTIVSMPAHTNPVLPGSDANIITDVAHHPQTRNLTCEEAALVMALSHERITRSEDDVLSDMGIDWTPATFDQSGNLQRSWITDDGTTIGWYGPHEHAVTLVGVERDVVIVDNPLQAGEWRRIAKSQFEASFQTFANMAVVLR